MGDCNETWKKESDVEINSMCYNQDQSLFVLATTRGYKIFDTASLTLVSKEDDYQDIIGNISQAQTLFRSPYVFFVGNENNENKYSTYPPNQLMIWNDLKKTKAGLIMMKFNISSFILTQNILAIFVSNVLYLFEVHSLKYIIKITNLNLNNKLYSINQDTVVYTTIQKKSIVNIIRFNFVEHKLKHKQNKKIVTSFQEIQAIQLSKGGEMLFVSSLLGNKIHIYDITDSSLKCCVFTGNRIISQEEIQFDFDIKHLLYISDQIKLEIIRLKNKDNQKANCCCEDYDDNIMLGNPRRKPSIFEGIMSGFTDKTKSSNGCGLISTLDIPNGMNSVLFAGFDLKRKKELVY